MTNPILDLKLFGNAEDAHRQCCQCCNGYCPMMDLGVSDSVPDPLLIVTLDGVDYITEQFLMVRADHVDLTGDAIRSNARPKMPAIPNEEPGPSTAGLGSYYMGLLTEAGLDIREGNDALSPQHVYRDGNHVGWLAPVKAKAGRSVLTLSDRDELAAIVADLPVVENAHPWRTAGRLLLWERDRDMTRRGAS